MVGQQDLANKDPFIHDQVDVGALSESWWGDIPPRPCTVPHSHPSAQPAYSSAMH